MINDYFLSPFRKCKIGDSYYDGDTSNFEASIGFVRYSRCDCQCDGQWQCQGGVYGGDRGDQSVDGRYFITACLHSQVGTGCLMVGTGDISMLIVGL